LPEEEDINMTVDEALAIAETVLGDEQLNDVQELIFRQCWNGRCSYEAISKLCRYDDEYIKKIAAQLWKQLSDGFGEKVKKNNLQTIINRYARRQNIILPRTQVVGVNLSGANLSGARILFANLSETDSFQDLRKATIKSNGENIIKSEPRDYEDRDSNAPKKNYQWQGLNLHSEAQIKIAETLDRASITFIANPQLRLTQCQERENPQGDFMIIYQNQIGLLNIDEEDRHQEIIDESENSDFNPSDIHLIKHYNINQCTEQPDEVVQDFLERLSHS